MRERQTAEEIMQYFGTAFGSMVTSTVEWKLEV